MAWWDSLVFYRKITVVAGCITAVLAAALAIANAMSAGEPYWVATRGYTRLLIGDAVKNIQQKQTEQIKGIELAEKSIENQQIKIEIQVLSSRVENIKAKIQDRQLLLKRDGPEQFKDLIRGQINDMTDSIAGLQNEITDLRAKLQH